MSGSLSIKKIVHTTWREGWHLVGDRETANGRVQDLVIRLCTDDALDFRAILQSDSVAQAVRQEISAAAVAGLNGTWYRGRRCAKAPPAHFGAPPAGSQAEGRYNRAGERVLYLAKSLRVVAAECSPTGIEPAVFAMPFELSLQTKYVPMPVALEERYPHLHYFLLASENIPEAGADLPLARSPYRATHFLRYLCEHLGIDAIEYPSVRAAALSRDEALNLAIFGSSLLQAEHMAVGLPIAVPSGDYA